MNMCVRVCVYVYRNAIEIPFLFKENNYRFLLKTNGNGNTMA